MKTYSEAQGQAPIDWNARLSRDPETITRHEWRQWRFDAGRWVTCACGNQCDIIPRDRKGMPEDLYLSEMGMFFSEAIGCRDMERARYILNCIEALSEELVAEIKNSSK